MTFLPETRRHGFLDVALVSASPSTGQGVRRQRDHDEESDSSHRKPGTSTHRRSGGGAAKDFHGSDASDGADDDRAGAAFKVSLTGRDGLGTDSEIAFECNLVGRWWLQYRRVWPRRA
jgi:hypothetical protein